MSYEFHAALAADLMHNLCIKEYPDGSIELTASPSACFRESGWERSDRWKPEASSRGRVGGEADNVRRSVRRAKSKLRDLARSNDFAYFVTLTLSPESADDRYDIGATVKQMTRWLDNRVRRHGLSYVLVPERHKDGAIHFHGLVNAALTAEDSGTLSAGGKPRRPRSAKQRAEWLAAGWHVVYNLPAWPFGFSTAIELYGEREAAISYVCKYIGKEMHNNDGKIGGRWYYSGGNLRRPHIYTSDCNFDEVAARFPGGCWGGPDGLQFCRTFVPRQDVAGALAGLGIGTRTGGQSSKETDGSPDGGGAAEDGCGN